MYDLLILLAKALPIRRNSSPGLPANRLLSLTDGETRRLSGARQESRASQRNTRTRHFADSEGRTEAPYSQQGSVHVKADLT